MRRETAYEAEDGKRHSEENLERQDVRQLRSKKVDRHHDGRGRTRIDIGTR